MPSSTAKAFEAADRPAGSVTRILVDDRCLRRPATGVANYLVNVVKAWPSQSSLRLEGLWTGVRSGPAAPAISDPDYPPLRLVPLSRLRPPAGAIFRPWWARRVVQLWEARKLARSFRGADFRACFAPNHLAVPCGGPVVTTIHDLSVLEYPQWHPADRVRLWQANLAASMAATTHWIAVSDFTAGRMSDVLGIAHDKITVIPSAARPLTYPSVAQLPSLRAAMRLPDRYLLHLGTIEPRKNLPVLLDAWQALPPEFRRNCRLVLAGGAGWGTGDFWPALANHPVADEVLMSGYVTDAQAAALLTGASALLLPSHYEGFALPILEAMACGTPVVCSTAPALCETAGSAALCVSADDPAAWAEAMRRACEDESWRLHMSDLGKARAAEFSWARTAAAHEAVLARVAQAF